MVDGNLALVYGAKSTWTESVWQERDRLLHHFSDFSIIPAGRHLWATGVKDRQFLFNCHVAPWGEKLSDHFEFTFMRLMEGGGVGANYSSRFLEPYGSPRRALKTHIVCDPDHPDYAEMMESGLLSTEFNSDWAGAFDVEDSREGWAGALVDLIDTAMTDDAVEHENRVYDVSRVRKKGARLKTFGGTASGPAPLAKMMHEVAAVLSEAAEYGEAVATLEEITHQGDGSHLSPMDAMDMDHAIASCVVAGGVRRSARMAGVHWKDPFIFDFIQSKKDKSKNWTTNISVIIDEDFLDLLQMTEGMVEGMTFEVFREWVDAQAVHEAAVEGMLTNGEPGYWNYDLSNDGEVNEVVITNPCLTGDTVIATVKGPRTFEELALAGEDVEVYSWDPKTKLPVVRWMRRPHLTRHEAEIVKVTFDSGLTVRCTPDHNFYTFRGEKVQARSLVPGRSIRAFSASFDGSNHERVHGWDSQRNAAAHQYTHRMIWENANGPIPDGMVVAHLDGDATNNVLENLQVMTPYEHASYDYPKRLAAGFDGHCPNHKVVSVEADGYADVYNGMVEDSHTYIILDPNPVAGHMSGVVSANCGEIALPERGACVLGHVNMDRFAPTKMGGAMDGPGLVEAHQLMTRFLIRATYGDMSDAGQKDVMQSERRIGVGHFGVQGFLAKYGIPYSLAPRNKVVRMLLASLKEVVREEARNYSFQLRIPEPVKVTTVAPTGSIAKLPGATEGIHPVLFRYFIQRIRFSATNPDQIAQVEAFRAEGLDVEVDQYDASGDTLIVCFPTEHLLVAQVVAMGFQAELVETASEISLEDMLDFQEMYQTEYADNAVSFTVNMAAEPHQLEGMLANPFGDVLPPTRERVAHVAKVLAKRLYRLKGTTLMIDGSRPQAPYEEITKAQYELATYVMNGDGIDEDCASGACPVR